jgi:hypothetical protein
MDQDRLTDVNSGSIWNLEQIVLVTANQVSQKLRIGLNSILPLNLF